MQWCKTHTISAIGSIGLTYLTGLHIKNTAYKNIKDDIDYAYFKGLHPEDKKELVRRFPENWTSDGEAMILSEHWDASWECAGGCIWYIGNIVNLKFDDNKNAPRINFDHWSYKLIISLPDPSVACLLVKGQPIINEIRFYPVTYTTDEFRNTFILKE
jgi:hypothetical protein